MARVSRKTKQPEALEAATPYWTTAIYARLSTLDNRQGTKESIVNQESILSEFIHNHQELRLREKYVDNGKTGTDFERPAWERMMADIRLGKIKCIIVKDLSRLGRNYIEAGDYLEKVFPFLGIRFVAVNDRYDSEKIFFRGNGLEVSLRNLINDFYSKDISRKIKSSFEVKKENGEYIGSSPPYGYLLRKGRLYPDDVAKGVVERIFRLKSEGISDYKIASTLNEENISCPSRYKCECGEKKYQNFAAALWQPQAIGRILQDEVYIGNTVHKFDGSLYSPCRGKLSKEYWQKFKNTHEPLVSRQLFEQARIQHERNAKIRKDYISKGSPGYENILRGILKCGICGKNIRRDKDIKTCNGEDVADYYFYCATKYTYADAGCNYKRIKDRRIYDVVFKQIMLQVDLAVGISEFMNGLSKSMLAQDNKADTRINDIKGEINKLSDIKFSLYEDMKGGGITKEEYASLKQRAGMRIEELKEEQELLKEKKKKQKEQLTDKNPWIFKFKRFAGSERLTREMAEELIEKVEIYGDDRIVITYRFRDELEAVTEYLKSKGMMHDAG